MFMSRGGAGSEILEAIAARQFAGVAGIAVHDWITAWRRSRDDPYLFVTGVLGYAPATVAVGATVAGDRLEAWQDEALRALRDGHKRLSIRSGHGVGKTTFLAWLVLWAISTHSDCKVPVAANSQDQLRDVIWPEIIKQHRRLPDELREQIDCQAERIVVKEAPDLAFAVRRTATKERPEALAGFHAEFLMFLLDEASGIDDAIYETASGALSTPGAIAVLTSNPTRSNGYFYETHHKLRDRWHTMCVSSEGVLRATGHIRDIVDAYGRNSNQYRVRVLGEFPTADEQTVIPLDIVEAAVGRQIDVINVCPIWGVDVARFGDDTSALAKRRGNHLLEPVQEWSNLDNVQLAGRIKAAFDATDDDLQPVAIMVDEIGLGAGVVDICRSYGLPVFGVNVAEAAANDTKYHRLRDELWFRGREWFHNRNCKIPKDEKLIAELTAPLYDFNMSGALVVEPKKLMKKRGLRSPNKADAFLNTFARADQKPKQKRRYLDFYEGASSWAA